MQTSKTVGTSSRAFNLDFFRGLAIFMVLFNHVNHETIPSIPDLTGISGFIFWFIKSLGWSGVDLFFVLSGFLISGLLFSEIEFSGKIRLGRFLIRRGMKIWPSYIVLLCILLFNDQTY